MTIRRNAHWKYEASNLRALTVIECACICLRLSVFVHVHDQPQTISNKYRISNRTWRRSAITSDLTVCGWSHSFECIASFRSTWRNFLKWKSFRNIQCMYMWVGVCLSMLTTSATPPITAASSSSSSGSRLSNVGYNVIIVALEPSKVLIRSPTQPARGRHSAHSFILIYAALPPQLFPKFQSFSTNFVYSALCIQTHT